MTKQATKEARNGVTWAAGTLAKHKCKMYSTKAGSWDVELPDGSWRAAEDWRELVDVAREVQFSSMEGALS